MSDSPCRSKASVSDAATLEAIAPSPNAKINKDQDLCLVSEAVQCSAVAYSWERVTSQREYLCYEYGYEIQKIERNITYRHSTPEQVSGSGVGAIDKHI